MRWGWVVIGVCALVLAAWLLLAPQLLGLGLTRGEWTGFIVLSVAMLLALNIAESVHEERLKAHR